MASRRRPPPDPREDPRVVRAIEQIERAGDRLALSTIRAYERTRLELLGRLLEGVDAAMDTQHNRMIVTLVDEALRRLYGELSSTYGSEVSNVIQNEAEQAITELRRLPLWVAADQALLASSSVTSPRISEGMVRAIVERCGEEIRAVNSTVKARIQGELTQSIIRGESVHKGMKRILAQGVTNDGLRRPFPSVYDRARTIAKTEIANAANVAHLTKYQEADRLTPGILVRWSSCLCSTTCGFCRAFHGQAPRRPGELWTHTIGSRTISVPCPVAHPNCMCRLVVTYRP